uniref:Basic proline-rich protein-like n=1 Tax=Phascolarctos cinereus TaxID=38626 RepID=A0A6P5LBS8_PHACI|nr:basic proline-rich protein-like [Phascolarctos cinereus]
MIPKRRSSSKSHRVRSPARGLRCGSTAKGAALRQRMGGRSPPPPRERETQLSSCPQGEAPSPSRSLPRPPIGGDRTHRLTGDVSLGGLNGTRVLEGPSIPSPCPGARGYSAHPPLVPYVTIHPVGLVVPGASQRALLLANFSSVLPPHTRNPFRRWLPQNRAEQIPIPHNRSPAAPSASTPSQPRAPRPSGHSPSPLTRRPRVCWTPGLSVPSPAFRLLQHPEAQPPFLHGPGVWERQPVLEHGCTGFPELQLPRRTGQGPGAELPDPPPEHGGQARVPYLPRLWAPAARILRPLASLWLCARGRCAPESRFLFGPRATARSASRHVASAALLPAAPPPPSPSSPLPASLPPPAAA